MRRPAIIATTWLVAMSALGQVKPSAAIPATQPTLSVSELPSAQADPATSRRSTHITWDGSQLTIEANGEPMPEILGRVARQTGMKITGGVPDEHLFGTYGPASVQTVLGELFDGLSVNMMLVNATSTKPKELILTSRTGGPTPPSTRPISEAPQQQDNNASEPIEPIAPLSGARPLLPVPTSPRPTNNSQPAFPPLPPPPAENNSFTNNGNAEPSNGNADGSQANRDTNNNADQPESPNGVKTPEQIFEELRRRAAAAQPQ